jgi:L-lysine 2,3-aminomutase
MVTDILFTGGDPMVMSASTLRHYMELLFGPNSPPQLNTIRIGTKSLAWWPYRYVTDPDAKQTLQLFSDVVNSGKHLSLQAHFSHPREVEHPVAQEAIRLIRMTGAQIRSQAPLIKHVNNDPDIWESMWKLQTKLGIIPYYMFVERDTGARDYFSVPLTRALQVFNTAYSRLPGTARTVRGPSMSASPGKICVVGDAVVNKQRCFVLKFLQSRNPNWSERIFFAKFDPKALWFDDLRPAFDGTAFFFEHEYQQQKQRVYEGSSGQLSDGDWGLQEFNS